MLLRSIPGEGRVLLSSPTANSFVDTTAKAGIAYTYLVVAVAGSGPTLAHSNPVSITA